MIYRNQQYLKIMAMYLCKSNPSFFYKSHFSFSFPLLFSSSSIDKKVKNDDLTVYNVLLHKHQFSPETASQVATVLTRIKNPEKSDSILSFFKESGFSKSQLERVVKTKPVLLAASLEKTIKPKFKIFQDFGFSAEEIAEIISSNPENFHRSADSRVRSLSILKRLLGSSAEITKVLKISGWYLTNDLEKSMVPNIEFLKSCGVGMEQIIKKMYNSPRFLLFSPKKMKLFVDTVDEMGTCRSSKMFIHAVRVVGSMSNENWELKLGHFRNLGFSEDDILKMFQKAPQVFSVSQRKISKVLEMLLATGKYDLSCIASSPKAFTSSVEKKIKPRLKVLAILESKNLIGKWPSLSSVARITDSKFVERFVQPYLNEVGEVYMAK